jgi:allophanate hydrolase
MSTEELTLSAIKEAYASGKVTPTALCQRLVEKIAASHAIMITKPRIAEVLERCKFLESLPAENRAAMPLWGVPFAVKDNIDVAGYPTTCACPDYSYYPDNHARVVAALLEAGAICLGKTNLDQFACGLVGTRTPYGIPSNSFDDRFTPGGSSSGSAVAVAEGMVTFALGTDTAGSGRVPAGQNGIVGIKPSLGRWSTVGVVPACYSLDCASVFALSVEDGAFIAKLLENNDVGDPTWRPRRTELLSKSLGSSSSKKKFRFAVPAPQYMDFSGPGGEPVRKAMEVAMADAVKKLKLIGGELITDFDFGPFAETAILLYGGAFVAERYSGIRSFLEARAPGLEPPELADLSIDQRLLKVTRSIIAKTEHWSAADVYEGQQTLSNLRGTARKQLEKIDILVVPTAAYNYTIREIMAEEDEQDYGAMLSGRAMVTKNANLGRFTNFVNLLDMCGVSVPSTVLKLGPENEAAAGAGKKQRKDKDAAAAPAATPVHASVTDRAEHLSNTGNPTATVPFGITLLAAAWTDSYVAEVASAYEKSTGLKAGPHGHGVKPYKTIGVIRPRKSSLGVGKNHPGGAN